MERDGVRMITSEVDQINQRLSQFNGGLARIWYFDVSLTRLLLHIQRSGSDTVIGLLAITCSRISGPFSWNVSSLGVSSHVGLVRIEDLGEPFFLECRSCVLIERREFGILNSLELLDERTHQGEQGEPEPG